MDINLIILIVLIFLAIIDLMVGVANDAINFLNSAIGSNAAKYKTILIVASLGVIAGVLVSGGMMEVARKGVFNPQYFEMSHLMIIFVSVMFQDVLLLDTFNTFGLPTSTTASIFFGLFGAGIAMAIVNVFEKGQSFEMIGQYMNTGKVLTIIAAILLSIVMAFIVGLIVQYITRLIFSFDFSSRFKRYGSLWSSVVITSLSMFLFIKGLKGSPLITDELYALLRGNLSLLALYSFIFWTVVLHFLIRYTKVKVLNGIVLFGTFALAMAFAANDLVNFIGAPIAALNAYEADIQGLSMSALQKEVPVNVFYVLVAGLIMVITLYFNKKARSVSETTIALSRQDEGLERFESNAIARSIVRMSYSSFKSIKKTIPQSLLSFINNRFDTSKFNPPADINGNKPAFDLLRAAVILFVAAALISFATILKLPLSTTYVTFIVAMAAALPDKAWGRDSAVYRISGVLTVVGGWFFTGLSASLVAMLIAFLIYFTGVFGLAGMFLLVMFILYKSNLYHKKREKDFKKEQARYDKKLLTKADSNQKMLDEISEYLVNISDVFIMSNKGLYDENFKLLKKSKKLTERIEKDIKFLNADIIKLIDKYDSEESEFASLGIKMTVALQDMCDKLYHSVHQNYKYVNNNHSSLGEPEKDLLIDLNNLTLDFVKKVSQELRELDYKEYPELKKQFDNITKISAKYYKAQLKRLKKKQSNVSKSLMILNLISDFEIQTELIIKVFESAKESKLHI